MNEELEMYATNESKYGTEPIGTVTVDFKLKYHEFPSDAPVVKPIQITDYRQIFQRLVIILHIYAHHVSVYVWLLLARLLILKRVTTMIAMEKL
jgi:hypothetical protein